jgi:hypothetical protein
MKPSSVFAIFGFAATALAGPLAGGEQATKVVVRTNEAVTSVIAQCSAAIVKLDGSVKAFAGDSKQIEADAIALVGTIRTGVASLGSAAEIELDAKLQASLSGLQTAASSLINNMVAAKAKFEAAGMCSTVLGAMTELSTQVKGLFDATSKLCGESAGGILSGLMSGLTDMLNKGTAAFGINVCKNTVGGGSGGSYPTATLTFTASNPILRTSTALPVTQGPPAGVTVTVTMPGDDCDVTTPTSAPVISQPPPPTPTTTTIRSTIIQTVSSVVQSNPPVPGTTGLFPTSARPSSPVVTAGAVANAAVPMGVVAIVAALAL